MNDPGSPEGRSLIRRRILGWGIASTIVQPGDHGRDIVLARRNGRLDLDFVQGIDNLAQDLEIALTTSLGSDVFNVSFGFDGLRALAEETNPVLVRERVRIAVIRVLRDDPRVRRIVDVNLLGALGAKDRAGADRDRLERTLEVRVEFETVTGDRVEVDLTQGGPTNV